MSEMLRVSSDDVDEFVESEGFLAELTENEMRGKAWLMTITSQLDTVEVIADELDIVSPELTVIVESGVDADTLQEVAASDEYDLLGYIISNNPDSFLFWAIDFSGVLLNQVTVENNSKVRVSLEASGYTFDTESPVWITV